MSFYREWNSGLLKLRNFLKTAHGRAKIQSQVFHVKLIQSTSDGHSLKRNMPEAGNCKLSWQDPCREVGGRNSGGRTTGAMPASCCGEGPEPVTVGARGGGRVSPASNSVFTSKHHCPPENPRLGRFWLAGPLWHHVCTGHPPGMLPWWYLWCNPLLF